MTKFSIEYNPYLVECIFRKNGKILNEKSKIGAKSKERLQVLLGEQGNWKGLLEEIAKACDDNNIEISFRGRRIDYDDLKYTIDLYKGKTRFKLLPNEEVTNDADIIAELDKIFGEIKKKNLPAFKVKNKEGKDIFDAYEEVKNGIFEVSVIATMSSGKSTLINSLLHTELLPSSNEACTATIAKIYDNDSMSEYMAECYAKDEKTIVYPRKKVSADDMQRYNADEKVTYIRIEGDIPGVTSDKIQLCLRDTPGPNNSRNENHERLTRTIIQQKNAVVLYVMNATQIGTKDDKQLLKDISFEMKKAGKQSRDRFIFVVNKADALDEGKGETLDKLLNNVREYLKQFDIINPTLIPTSAYLALLIRKNRIGAKLTRKEKSDLNQVGDFVDYKELHFEKYATLTPSVKSYLKKEVDRNHKNEDDLEALIHTGVPAVEQTINEYIEKYAYPMKIKDAIKDITAILDELDMRSKFEKEIAEDSEKLRQVRTQIQEAKRKFEKSNSVYDDFKEKISLLKLSGTMQNEEKFKMETDLNAMMHEYDKHEKVDKLIADQMIDTFVSRLEYYQKDYKKRLDREIDGTIYKRCMEMLEEYKSVVSDVLNGIEIEGFDFKKVSSIEKIRIPDINALKMLNQHDRYKTEVRWKDNPERQGFFGFFKFWEPKQISYNVRVKDGVDVNVKQIVVNIIASLKKSMNENVLSIFEQAENQVEAYKNVFKWNIENLRKEIGNILEDLDEKTKESKMLSKCVEDNRELLKWVDGKEKQLKNLLTF